MQFVNRSRERKELPPKKSCGATNALMKYEFPASREGILAGWNKMDIGFLEGTSGTPVDLLFFFFSPRLELNDWFSLFEYLKIEPAIDIYSMEIN